MSLSIAEVGLALAIHYLKGITTILKLHTVAIRIKWEGRKLRSLLRIVFNIHRPLCCFEVLTWVFIKEDTALNSGYLNWIKTRCYNSRFGCKWHFSFRSNAFCHSNLCKGTKSWSRLPSSLWFICYDFCFWHNDMGSSLKVALRSALLIEEVSVL